MGYLVHVNRPSNKAKLHVEGGCASVKKAMDRISHGEPYGPICGDDNGEWMGPFATIEDARIAQSNTGKAHQDDCGAYGCREHFSTLT